MSTQTKTVFVTGATRGIGKAIVEQFHLSGARVIGVGTQANAKGYFDKYFQADFTRQNEINACAEFLKKIEPDILVNNAGININASFTEILLEDFQRIQQVNVLTPFLLCQAAIPAMKQRGWGRIVNVSSIWGKISKAHRASYSASKFALDGLTVALSAEFASDGILANCIAPGFTETDLTHNMLGDKGIQAIAATIPMGRLATVEEIARFVVWLCSTENTYITGQNIAIDGGFSRV